MSRRVRLVLAVVAVVVLAAAVWFLVLNPIRQDIAAAERDTKDMRVRLSAAQARLAQAEVTQQEGRRNQARLLELAKMIPETEEIPSLILQIQDLANQSGIAFTAISPGTVTELKGEGVSFLPLDLTLTGTYFDISDFVYRAEQMVSGPGRLLAIKSLSIELTANETELAPGTSPDLEAHLTVYAFVAGVPAASTTPTPAPAGTTTPTPGSQ